MGWFVWLIIGATAGCVANLMMNSERQQGLPIDIMVGIIGAFIGGYLFNLMQAPGAVDFNTWRIVVPFIGSVVLLLTIRMFGRRGSFSKSQNIS